MKRRSILTTLLFCLITAITVSLTYAQTVSTGEIANTAWPTFQRDMSRTGQSSYLSISTTPQLLWKTPSLSSCGGGGESSQGMSIGVDGTVYASVNGCLVAIDPVDGAVKWKGIPGNWNSRSTPTISADGTIYWGFANVFMAITTTGQTIWQAQLGANLIFASSPAIASDGSLYFVQDAVWSVNPNGSLRWVYPFGWYAYSSPTIGIDDTIYINSTTTLYAFDSDGSVKWTGIGGQCGSSPSIGNDGTIYSGLANGRLYAYKPDGALKWTFDTGNNNRCGPGVSLGPDGTIYFGTGSGGSDINYVYAINPDGTLKWQHLTPIGTYSSWTLAPIVVDRLNRPIACADNGSCYGFSPDGTLLWQYTALQDSGMRTAPLIVSNGTVLVLDSSGVIHALSDPTIPRLGVNPRPYTIFAEYGTTMLTATLQVTSTILPITWTANLSPVPSWASVPITSGLTPSALPVVLTPSELVTGSYSLNLTIEAGNSDVANRKLNVPVKLIIGARQMYLPIISKS